MRTFSVLIAIAMIICSTTLDARAQGRPATRACTTNICLLRRIVTLETNVADLTKLLDAATQQIAAVTTKLETVNEQSDTLLRQLDTVNKQLAILNKNSLKSGQTVTLNSPSGCLSYSTPVDIKTGPVWWSNPCKNGNWIIR
jgi:uncharacterized coiled-coil protein SlyX